MTHPRHGDDVRVRQSLAQHSPCFGFHNAVFLSFDNEDPGTARKSCQHAIAPSEQIKILWNVKENPAKGNAKKTAQDRLLSLTLPGAGGRATLYATS